MSSVQQFGFYSYIEKKKKTFDCVKFSHVEFQGNLPVGLLNVILGRLLGHAQHLVIARGLSDAVDQLDLRKDSVKTSIKKKELATKIHFPAWKPHNWIEISRITRNSALRYIYPSRNNPLSYKQCTCT